MKVSGLILTCDQEKNLYRTIKSILGVVDEIVIIDSGPNFTSSNKKYKNDCIKFYHYKWGNDFSKARNKAISLATNDICFFIDADEYLHNDSRDYFRETINIAFKRDNKSIYAPKIDNLNGKVLRNNGRIFFKRSTIKYIGLVHEYLYEPGANIITLENIILNHDGYNSPEINLMKRRRNLHLLEKQIKSDPHNLRWYFFMLRYLGDDDEKRHNILKKFSRLPLPYEHSIEVYALNAKCMFTLHSINTGDYETASIHAEELNKHYKDLTCAKLLFLSKYLFLEYNHIKSIRDLSVIHNSLYRKEKDDYILGEICNDLFDKVEIKFMIDSILLNSF